MLELPISSTARRALLATKGTDNIELQLVLVHDVILKVNNKINKGILKQ